MPSLQSLLKEFGIDLKQYGIELPTTGPRQKQKIKSRPQWWYYFNNNPTYKVSCPYCGSKVFPDFRCSNCGKPLDTFLEQKYQEAISGEMARDLDLARRLARKWGYDLVKIKE